MIKVHKYTAPSSWASYLINGDATGFDYSNTKDDPEAGDREQEACDAWVESIGLGSPVSCEDAGFMWRHDAREFCPYGADCQEYVFCEHVEETT